MDDLDILDFSCQDFAITFSDEEVVLNDRIIPDPFQGAKSPWHIGHHTPAPASVRVRLLIAPELVDLSQSIHDGAETTGGISLQISLVSFKFGTPMHA
ncbi:hypothetical protein PILCRDRAFT_825987 [Piloderma croceum F 1598]|uniref:Uncharacterized protein n=1 Tax=Piloderma croceum (strain F 1598) TaxID=765440 RepID=A0A0C3FA42_PILCF|nr:hypothetical protein PILCRDRAFT_825987 [Piloderma croceum F 1598]